MQKKSHRGNSTGESMKALNRKLWRDLWHMKGQALAIALVIVSGVATFVMFISTMDTLNMTRDAFYRDYGFAEVFASLKRAPERIRERIEEIPGVDKVETRVIADVKLDITGYPEPVTARLVSIPGDSGPHLNRLFLRKGRLVDPWRDDEVVVSEAFADAHGFSPGNTFGAVINGRWKTLVITGIALSPEFVLQVKPGAISPDYSRYGILWMSRYALEKAYDMDGAFNDVVMTLARGARVEDVLVRLDEVLSRYGGLGSYSRKDQMSNRFLTEEFRQLQRSAEIFPTIFIGVSAFLLNVVISRTVSTQREQAAALKAFGYSNLQIGIHYVKLVVVIALLGIAGGIVVGIWLGKGLGGIYMEYYRFPYLHFELQPGVALTAAAITLGAAVSGTIHSVWKASRLPPAEAMRPEPPARYRKTVIEYFMPAGLLSQPSRMIARNIERKPVKSFLSVVGIGFACAIMITGGFFSDAVDFMVDIQFKRSHKEDITVTFTEPTSRKALYELQGMRGVGHAEVFRSVPVRMRHRHLVYRTSVQGIERGNRLSLLLDTDLNEVELPPAGIVLTDYLGGILGVGPGDVLTLEVLEGSRPVLQVPVAGLVSQYIGVNGYMDLNALNRLMREGNAVSGAYLAIDTLYQEEIYKNLLEMPRVAGAAVRKDEIRNFYETQAESMLFFTFVASVLAGVIAFGVVYNSARINLAERSHELASLRVLGYTRGEISYILLGELGLLTLAAIPLGFFIGRALSSYIAKALESDLFRIPVAIEPATFALAAAVVLVSAAVSGLIVRHRLDHLDLVAVLKTKE
jgi:putative ABC transport system permease protein